MVVIDEDWRSRDLNYGGMALLEGSLFVLLHIVSENMKIYKAVSHF